MGFSPFAAAGVFFHYKEYDYYRDDQYVNLTTTIKTKELGALGRAGIMYVPNDYFMVSLDFGYGYGYNPWSNTTQAYYKTGFTISYSWYK